MSSLVKIRNPYLNDIHWQPFELRHQPLLIFFQWLERQRILSEQERTMQLNQQRLNNQRIYQGVNPILPNTHMKIKNFVRIENPPSKAKSNYTLRVCFDTHLGCYPGLMVYFVTWLFQLTYQCSQPLVIILFIDGWMTDLNEPVVNKSLPVMNDPDLIFFKKYWTCKRSTEVFKMSMLLHFPDQLLHRPNILMQKAWTMRDVTLKVRERSKF